MPPPGQTVAAPPANHVPFGAHDLARKEIRDVRSDGNYFTDEFVADDHRDGDGALRPGIPVVDVEVGAANAGAVHPNQDVIDACARRRHFLEPQTGARLPFDQGFHSRVH